MHIERITPSVEVHFSRIHEGKVFTLSNDNHRRVFMKIGEVVVRERGIISAYVDLETGGTYINGNSLTNVRPVEAKVIIS